MLKKTILLIGSSQVLMDITKRILERVGYCVRCAVGIAGAEEQLMDFAPDGIILDNDLPDGKGLDYCQSLKLKVPVPILFLSGAKEDELPALRAGASDFIRKPFDYEIMKARIGVMMNTMGESADADDAKPDTAPPVGSEETERLSRSAQPESTTGSVKKKSVHRAGRLYLTIAACFVFILTGTVLFQGLTKAPGEFIPDEQVPLAAFPFQVEQSAKPYNGESQYISFPGIDSLSTPANATDLKVFLLNPAGNSCYFVFELILADTGESLYTSGMVEPGMCVERIALSRGLEKSEYNATLIIRAYALEDFAAMNGAKLDFTLTAN